MTFISGTCKHLINEMHTLWLHSWDEGRSYLKESLFLHLVRLRDKIVSTHGGGAKCEKKIYSKA
jgi:hypothetical protein